MNLMKVGETKVEFRFFFSVQILSLVCVTLTLAEPPSSSYGPPPPPSSSYGAPNIGLSAGVGSGYQAVGSGYQESEGANLDPQLLHKIEEILLDEENQKSSRTSSIHWFLFGNAVCEQSIITKLNYFVENLGGFSGSLSSSYGPPSSSYGPPPAGHHERVVGMYIVNGLLI